jgi:hypothetical protein
MMEVAASWLVENPDPDSTMLRIPGATMRRDTQLQHEAWLREKRELVAARPEIARVASEKLDEVESVLRERADLHRDMDQAEAKLEDMINQGIRPAHRKLCADTTLHSDVGRWCLAWARHGHNVFDLSADFTAAMLLTDPEQIDISSVKMPFAGLLLFIPDGFVRGAGGTTYTKIHVTEMSINALRQLEVTSGIIDAFSLLTPDRARAVVDRIRNDIDRSGGILAPSTLLGPPAYVGLRDLEPDDTALHIYATDGTNVLDTLTMRSGLTWSALEDLPDAIDDDADRSASHAVRRIVFGTLAYLSAVPGAREIRERTGKRARRVAAGPGPVLWDVGRTVGIDNPLVGQSPGGADRSAAGAPVPWRVAGDRAPHQTSPHRARALPGPAARTREERAETDLDRPVLERARGWRSAGAHVPARDASRSEALTHNRHGYRMETHD